MAEQADLEIKCPCGGTATVTSDVATGEPASLLHTLPTCPQYVDLEPDEYLRWLRGTLEGRFDA